MSTKDGSIPIGDEQEPQLPARVTASYDAVLTILKEKQWMVFTWPDCRSEILVTITSAKKISMVHECVLSETQTVLEQMIAKSPSEFDKVMHVVLGAFK